MRDLGLGGRLPLLRPEGLEPEARMLYDRLVNRWRGQASPFRNRTDAGELIGPFNACLYAPKIATGFLDMHETEEQVTPLSVRLREVVILSVGAVWECSYELYAHTAVATRAGFSVDTVAALAAGKASNEMTESERAVQRFTLELTRGRRVSNETYSASESTLGRDSVIAIVFLTAAYLGTCAVLNAFAVPGPASNAQIQF